MKKLNYFNWRFFLIMIFLIASITAIFIRIIYLQIDKENLMALIRTHVDSIDSIY